MTSGTGLRHVLLRQYGAAEGEPVPTYGAAAEELLGIATEVSRAGRHGWIQVVADFGPALDDEFELLRSLVRASGLPLTLSLLQRETWPDEWRTLLDLIEVANREGLPITGQTRGRPTTPSAPARPAGRCPSPGCTLAP